MDNINKAPGGTPVRHKLKKVKRPIKRPVSTPETLSVPPKTTEFAAPRPDQSIAPAMTSSAAAEEHQAPVPEKMDAFSLDAFLDGDNLPAIQQDTRLQQNNFERGFIRAEIVSFADLMECGSYAAAREKGLVRSEGKDYVMKDGDVTLFRFNV